MEVLLIVIFGIAGAAFGSFINVCIDRLPAGKSLLYPPSHCDGCQKKLSALELIPVFSYIILRGRCRSCGAKIPLSVLMVELGCGGWTAFLLWYKGLNAEFGVIAFFSLIFVLIGMLDLKHKLVYGIVVFPAIAIALLVDAFVMPRGIINSLEGAGLGAFIIFLPFIVTRGGGMGFGDVEIAILIGLVTGFAEVFVAIMGGIVMGGVVAIVLLATRLKGRKDFIPFGPFLSLAAIITMVWGNSLLHWWLNLFIP
jgi:leader peptidase (prepilin peptidase) / N-methyltransferase